MEVKNIKNKLFKYPLILLNTIYSSIICTLVYMILEGKSLNNSIFIEILKNMHYLITVGFIFSIFPQIILYIIIIFVNKIVKINKIIDLILVIILGFIMAFIFIYIFFGADTFKDFIIMDDRFYLSTIISGVIFRIILYIINKIK
jgi:hypothetical protein